MYYSDKKSELIKITRVSVLFMAVAFLFSAFFSGDKVERTTLWAKEEVDAVSEIATENTETREGTDMADDLTRTIDEISEEVSPSFVFDRERMTEKYVVIPKFASGSRNAVLIDDYIYRTFYIDVKEGYDGAYNADNILRYAGDNEFKGKPEDLILPPYMEAFLKGNPYVSEESEKAYEDIESGKRKQKKNDDPVINIKITKDFKSTGKTRIALTFDRLYIPELLEDNSNYYISLKSPKDAYKKIIVIDLGHGGRDAGTFSGDKKVLEKDTTLSFGLLLKEIFDRQDEIKVYFTRLSDATVYRRPRADLANELEADFFLSIHNNNYTVLGRPIDFNEVRGTEIHYNEKISGTKVSSRRFAELILNAVHSSLGTRKRGIVEGSGWYVLGHTNMPSALIEIGFLTNIDDLELIQDENRMKACAEEMYKAILQAFEENEE